MPHYVYAGTLRGSVLGVARFKVGASGALESLSGGGFLTGLPNRGKVDLDNRFLLVAGPSSVGGGRIDKFVIRADGSLEAAAPSVPAGNQTFDVAFDPKGRFVYASNRDDNTISQFRIHTGGAMTALAPATVGSLAKTGPLSHTTGGTYIYAVTAGGAGGGTVRQYKFSGTTGQLTPLAPASVTLSAGETGPHEILVTPNGRFAYVAEFGGTIRQFRVQSNGTLAALSPATISVLGGPSEMAADTNSRFLYVGCTGSKILQFAIGVDGQLSPLSPESITVGMSPWRVVMVAGKFLYAADPTGDAIWQFRRESNGTLVLLDPPKVILNLPFFVTTAFKR